jgi:hypothetical protein
MSANSGRGGRERQGQHQRGRELDITSEEEADGGQPRRPAAAPVAAAVQRLNNYVRWSNDKVLMVLEALHSAPTRIYQSNRFDATNNIEGEPKINLSRLECV